MYTSAFRIMGTCHRYFLPIALVFYLNSRGSLVSASPEAPFCPHKTVGMRYQTRAI